MDTGRWDRPCLLSCDYSDMPGILFILLVIGENADKSGLECEEISFGRRCGLKKLRPREMHPWQTHSLGDGGVFSGQSDRGCARLGFSGRGQCRPAGSCSLYISGLCSGGWICCQRGAGGPSGVLRRPVRPQVTRPGLTNRVGRPRIPGAIVFPGSAPSPSAVQGGLGSSVGLNGAPRRRTLLDPPFGERGPRHSRLAARRGVQRARISSEPRITLNGHVLSYILRYHIRYITIPYTIYYDTNACWY